MKRDPPESAALRDWKLYDALRPMSQSPIKGPTFKAWAMAHKNELLALIPQAK